MCQARFPELEDRLFQWIDTMRRLNLELPPYLVIAQAIEPAKTLEIPANDFKASWRWLMKLRAQKGLGSVLLCDEGAEVNKEDPELLLWLNDCHDIRMKYPAGNANNLDKTGLFFRLLPRYTLLMPNEDFSTMRGKTKLKDQVTLVVCAKTDGSSKVPCRMIGKSKAPAYIVGRTWCIPYHNQKKA
jgi:hypothetical protein